MAAKYKPKPKPVVVSKISVREFRAWLSGVEEMQPDGWSPDAGQWKKIREKINTLADSVVHETTVQNITNNTASKHTNSVPQQQTAQNSPPPSGPVVRRVPALSELDPQIPTQISSLPVSAPTRAPVPGAQPAVKTPDIDTQKEPYKTPFV